MVKSRRLVDATGNHGDNTECGLRRSQDALKGSVIVDTHPGSLTGSKSTAMHPGAATRSNITTRWSGGSGGDWTDGKVTAGEFSGTPWNWCPRADLLLLLRRVC